jgi:hypothetical protein
MQQVAPVSTQIALPPGEKFMRWELLFIVVCQAGKQQSFSSLVEDESIKIGTDDKTELGTTLGRLKDGVGKVYNSMTVGMILSDERDRIL